MVGVEGVESGYMGGTVKNPSYGQVQTVGLVWVGWVGGGDGWVHASQLILTAFVGVGWVGWIG